MQRLDTVVAPEPSKDRVRVGVVHAASLRAVRPCNEHAGLCQTRPMTEGAPTELCDMTAVAQRTLLAAGDVSAVELFESHRARIEAVNPTVNAVVAMDLDIGRAGAERIDDTIAAGEDPGRLAGLVTAHKNLADTVDFPTSYGSPVFAEHRPLADNLLVARMKAAGVVAVGKTNTSEFGVGSHSFNPVHGTTANPWDPTRSAGGSSGGAGAALAAGMVAIADGSDMGGSLRNPAAWNNVVGLRASPGRVPNVGPGNAWSNFGTGGAMGRTVDDLALLLDVLAESDVRDPLSRGLAVPTPVTPIDRRVRVAWSEDLGGLPIQSHVRAALVKTRRSMVDLGWDVVDAELDFSGADECFLTIRAWVHANSTGLAVGDRLGETKPSVQLEVTQGRALSGTDVAAAHAHLAVLWRRSVAFFESFDLLAGPMTQVSPFPADQDYPTEVDGQPMARYTDWMRSACRITTTGLPAMSLPAGFTDPSAHGAALPVGVQLVGRPWGDLELLSMAKTLESATEHHRRRPPIIAG